MLLLFGLGIHLCALLNAYFNQSPQTAVYLEVDSPDNCNSLESKFQDPKQAQKAIEPYIGASVGAHIFACKIEIKSPFLNCIMNLYLNREHNAYDYPVCLPDFHGNHGVHHVVTREITDEIKEFDFAMLSKNNCSYLNKSFKEHLHTSPCVLPRGVEYQSMSTTMLVCYVCGLLGFYIGVSIVKSLDLNHFRNQIKKLSLGNILYRFLPSEKSIFVTLWAFATLFFVTQTFFFLTKQFYISRFERYSEYDTGLLLTLSICPWPQFDISCQDKNRSIVERGLQQEKCVKSQNVILKYKMNTLFHCGHNKHNLEPAVTETVLGKCITCLGHTSNEESLTPSFGYIQMLNPFPLEYRPSLLYFIVHAKDDEVLWDGRVDFPLLSGSYKLIDIDEIHSFSGGLYQGTLVKCLTDCYGKYLQANNISTETSYDKSYIEYSDPSQMLPTEILHECRIKCQYTEYTTFKGEEEVYDIQKFQSVSSIQTRLNISKISNISQITVNINCNGRVSNKVVVERDYNLEQFASDVAGVVTFIFGISLLSVLGMFATRLQKIIGRS